MNPWLILAAIALAKSVYDDITSGQKPEPEPEPKPEPEHDSGQKNNKIIS